MANNELLGKLIPKEAFNPRPELARRPEILVRYGILFASVSVLTGLSAPPNARLILGTIYDVYLFYVSLAILFVFGIGLIGLGWYAADEPGDHNVATRIAIRASQLILVVAVLLYEVIANR